MTQRNRWNALALLLSAVLLLPLAGNLQAQESRIKPAQELRAGVLPAPIRLQAGTFVPTRGETLDLPEELRIAAYPEGQAGYYLVQFEGPIQPEWKARIRELGGTLLDYIPDLAFIVHMDEPTRSAVGGLPEVVWVGLLQPAYKLSPALDGVEGNQQLMILTFPTEPIEVVAVQVEALGGRISNTATNDFGGLLYLAADTSDLAALAHIPAVHWIEPRYERVLFNDVARGNAIMGAETAWSNLGLYGQGQVVAVADTGLDTGSLSTLHDDFRGDPTGCTNTNRVVATYARGRTNDWSDSCYNGGNHGGHGTHVAGSVLGNGCNSGSSGTPDYGGSHAGLAPQASLVFQSIMDSDCALGGLPTDLNDLFAQAAGAGAKIHTNSWGASYAGQYTTDSRNTDVYLWNNKDFTILFAAGNDGVDGNSDGRVDLDSMGAPATAKNCITVGATENYRLYGGVNPEHSGDPWDEVQCSGNGGGPGWGNCWPDDFPTNPILDDTVSDDSTGMAAFSSRGPTDDGRIKPDLLAPGTNILSTKSQGLYVGTGWGPGENDFYQFMGGTSMATPLTAGGTALVRQFYTDLEGITPSSALIKATLINSAVDVYPGQYGSPVEQWPDQLPNNVQGWGRVDIAGATDGSHSYQDLADGSGLNTGESHNYNHTVCSTNFLRVTLVWTDYPGSTLTGGALVNDLDLTVTSPGGVQTYLGNVFANGWSTTGGSADRANNVESVYIQTPTAGEWTVTVSGHNITQGSRPGYALVVDMPDNVCEPDFTIEATPASLDVCAPNDATFDVDVGQILGFSDPVDLSTSGRPANTTESFSPDPVTPPGSSLLTIGNTGAAGGGTYAIDVIGTSGTTVHQDTVTLNLYGGVPDAPALNTPGAGATDVSVYPTFAWSSIPYASTYNIEIATDAGFSNIVYNATVSATSHTLSSALDMDTTYYWRVNAQNPCGSGSFSSAFDFTTQSASLVCNSATVDFGEGIPADWSVLINSSQNPNVFWTDLASCGESGNFAGGSGETACVSSDLQGNGLYNTELRTSPIDLTGFSAVTLGYLANYQNYGLVDYLNVGISTDGGSNWTTLQSWNEDHGGFRATPGESVSLDLTSYAGQTVILRWHYYDPEGPLYSEDWYAQIDDVTLTCTAVPDVEIEPDSLSSSQPPTWQETRPLDIQNIGQLELTWSMEEEPGILGTLTHDPQAKNEIALRAHVLPHPQAFSDELFQINAQASTGHSLLLGVEYANGYYWVTSGGQTGTADTNYLFQLDDDGAVVGSWPQETSSTWGWRDLAFDGTYLYASDSNVVDQIDPASGQATGTTIPCPENPCRALAYDPATDHFWTQNFGNSLYEFDRSGTVINTFNNTTSLAAYGAAWDAVSAGGPYLWIWSQNGPDTNQQVTATQVDPATGTPTGTSFLGSRVGSGDNIAGGATVSSDVVPGKQVFIGLHQADADTIAGYELALTQCNNPSDIPWVSVAPLNGTVPPGSSTSIDVTFDSTGYAPGSYAGNLCVNSNDPKQPIVAVPLDLVVQTVDYSDLASSYGVAWHTGDGTHRLGTSWNADTSFAAGQDDDNDDGVDPKPNDRWAPGTSVSLLVDVAGGGYLAGWFDWNDDGDFADPGEQAIGQNVPAQLDYAVSFTIPSDAGYVQDRPVNARLRLYSSEPTIILGTETASGGADGGEVQDHEITPPIPTAVELVRFEAAIDGPNLRLEWETAAEIDTLGFHLYRSTTPDGEYSRLNAALIPSQVPPGSPVGAAYSWLDESVASGATYHYRLKVLNSHGTSALYGPVSATAAPTSGYVIYLPALWK